MKDKTKKTDSPRGESAKSSKKITSRQVVAMAGVILLVLMYVATLVLALTDNSSSGKFFALSLSCTLVIPIIIFLYNWMYSRITGKKAMGDPDEAGRDDEA